ncbi:nucleotidyltransferase family protein, partial [Pseudomonadota bacterium]
GTRLKPMTDLLPKCLMPIRGRPLMEYWLADLRRAGVKEIMINLHHGANQVRDFLLQYTDSGLNTELVYESELKGTGGTLRYNHDFFFGHTVLLVHADNFCRCDFEAFINHHRHRPAGTAMTMMTFTADDPRQCGVVEVDALGVVQGLHEKVADPPGRLANAAVYLIENEVLEYLSNLDNEFVDFSTDVLPAFVGRISTWFNTGVHRDIGTPASLVAAQKECFTPLSHSSSAWAHDFARHPIHQKLSDLKGEKL